MVNEEDRAGYHIAIGVLNNNLEVIQALEPFDEICLPVTVCGELLFGAINSQARSRNLENFKAFINSCIVLNSNALTADAYAAIRFELKERGRPIPENDIWIAAICQVNDIPLFTTDKHFGYIPNLTLVR
jgi:tRNA(fMet)-specific endonuclease VapC